MAQKTLKATLLLKNKTKASWASLDHILSKGEMGIEIDTRKYKIGDGISSWNNLKYASGGNIELRAVNPISSDYDFEPGTMWINTVNNKAFLLFAVIDGSAMWSELATVNGTVANADKLSTPRDITFKGAVEEISQKFDGSKNIEFNLILSVSGVKAGTYTKLTVNDKGIVTAATGLTAEDIPNLKLNKISDAGTAASRDTGIEAGNIPILDSNGKLNTSVLPSLAITETSVVSSESEMLALTAQPGDVAIRADEDKSYILKGNDPTQLDNWEMLRTPNCKVLSVNGKTGAVSLTTDDIEEGAKNLYFTEERATNNFENNIKETTVSKLKDGENVVMDTDYLILDGGDSTEGE